MENLKEYLRKNSNGTYSYIGSVRPEHVSDFMIEIPEGAIKAYLNNSKTINFVNSDDDYMNHVTKGEWVSTHRGMHEKCGHVLVWSRHTHPEELPFIDDEPKRKRISVTISKPSLNDQYAEIEKVRQNGLKLDNGKPRHSLLPKGSISSIIAVLEFGAKKYEANNWQKVDNAKERYYDAAMRHIDSWWNGEKFDQETGIHHLAHAATNLFFLKWFDDKDNNNE